jgi:hypothetical protein
MRVTYKFLIVGFVFTYVVFAQILVPIKNQIPILLKAMNYEMKLKEKVRNAKNVNIALIYNEQDELSIKMMRESKKWFKKKDGIKIDGKKIKVIPVAYRNPADLQKKIVIYNIHVIYFCIGLDPYLSEIAEVSRSNAIITLSPRWEDIQKGYAVLGVAMAADGLRPYVNYIVAKEHFLEFDIKFLNVAEVIKN